MAVSSQPLISVNCFIYKFIGETNLKGICSREENFPLHSYESKSNPFVCVPLSSATLSLFLSSFPTQSKDLGQGGCEERILYLTKRAAERERRKRYEGKGSEWVKKLQHGGQYAVVIVGGGEGSIILLLLEFEEREV